MTNLDMSRGPALREVVDLLKERADDFVVSLRGGSMLPSLGEGDRLVVRPGLAVRPGDLVAFVGPDGVPWVHRAILPGHPVAGERSWRTRGDGGGPLDPPVALSSILGRVVARRSEAEDHPFSRVDSLYRLIRFHAIPLLLDRIRPRRQEAPIA